MWKNGNITTLARKRINLKSGSIPTIFEDEKHGVAGKSDFDQNQDDQSVQGNSDFDLNQDDQSVPGNSDFDPNLEKTSSNLLQDEEHSNFEEIRLLQSAKTLISQKRKAAQNGLQLQAKKMLKFSNNKFLPAAVGDSVKIPIPDVNRGRTDPKNLIVTFLSVHNETYALGTREGRLNQHYTRNQFTLCRQKFLLPTEVPETKKSLREIVNAQSLTGGQGYKRCFCKGHCDTRRCSCKAENIQWNSKCYSSGPCKNK
ncbi:uncharacterized protein LOC127278873 [Leptopilina boulardi]|uniref:uncharacterized protein LOC127278873 n=1 Tax=Leptopilina boulardi TaxID=63433 RepID=UPI0021F60983|nr:uncharacterized protein LOC127278873 [Leptopilina boulardi]